MKWRLMHIVCIVNCLILFTSCWDSQELSDIGLVFAMGIEKDKQTGEYILYNQMVKPGEEKTEVFITSGTGKSIFEANRKIAQKFDRVLEYTNTDIIVIDEKLAKEGIKSIIDFTSRSIQLRQIIWIAVGKSDVKELLTINNGMEEIQASYLEKMIKESSKNSIATISTMLDFTKKYTKEGIEPIASVFQLSSELNKNNTKENEIELVGTAVFKEDILIGFLNENETRGLNWIIGEVKSGVIQVEHEESLLTIEIKNASSKIIPQVNNGEISFTIQIHESGNIAEENGNADISDINVFDAIAKQQKEVITNEVNSALKKVQSEYKSDVFGFGEALHKKYPKVWDEVKEDWDEIFPSVECKLNIETKLTRTGLLKEPLEKK